VGSENPDKRTVFCYLDLYNVRSEEQFWQKFALQVVRASSSKWEEWMESIQKFLKRLIPRFSVGIDPINDFTFTLDYASIKESPEEVLDLPERLAEEKGIRLVVCIDEFQNLSFFDQPLAFQKQLRSSWQHHRHACYILYGSKKHLMGELFQDNQMPFYRFGDLISLQKIEKKYWIPFITNSFQITGKSISEQVADSITDLMDNHPYYVQFLSYQCWSRTAHECTEKVLAEALEDVLNQQTILFQRETDSLTNFQLNFLLAVAAGEQHLSKLETLNKYRMGSQGNIKRIKQSLEDRELIDISGKAIEIQDPLYKIWLRKNFQAG
jgi:hypothetical protein